MKTQRRFTVVLLSLLAACTDGNRNVGADTGGNSGNPAPAQVQNVPIIDNEDMSPGLKGVDADGNGIRDDIDRLIAKKYATNETMKKATEMQARALQKAMEATTPREARAAGNALMQAGSCVYKAFPHATSEQVKLREKMSIEIEALTANTRERFQAYWNGEKLAGGMVFNFPNEPICN
jgi:hypothetical protein